jgi:hypothetical protein
MGTDVSSIAALATQLADIRNGQAIGIAVLKKALEIEQENSAMLLEALVNSGPARNPAHLGSNIDTYA